MLQRGCGSRAPRLGQRLPILPHTNLAVLCKALDHDQSGISGAWIEAPLPCVPAAGPNIRCTMIQLPTHHFQQRKFSSLSTHRLIKKDWLILYCVQSLSTLRLDRQDQCVKGESIYSSQE